MSRSKEFWVDVPDGRVWGVHFSPEVRTSKAPLICLHGGPAVGHQYLLNVADAVTDRDVIFYDQLGAGSSRIANAEEIDWSPARFSEELKEIVTYFHADQAILFGHSFGGGVILEFAAMYPKNIAGIVLSGPLLNTQQQVATARAYVEDFPSEVKGPIQKSWRTPHSQPSEYKEAMKAYLAKHFCCQSPWPDALQAISSGFAHEPFEKIWGPLKFYPNGAWADFDRSQVLGQLECPVWASTSTTDESHPDLLEAALPPGACFTEFTKSAHFPHLEEEAAFMKELKKFLSAIG